MGHPLVFSVRYQPNIADNVLREAPFFGRDPTGCPAHHRRGDTPWSGDNQQNMGIVWVNFNDFTS
jgi:hypothetical protein